MIRQGSDEALSHAAIDLFRDDRRLVGRLRVVAFTDEEHDPTPSQVVATATRRPVAAHDDQMVPRQLRRPLGVVAGVVPVDEHHGLIAHHPGIVALRQCRDLSGSFTPSPSTFSGSVPMVCSNASDRPLAPLAPQPVAQKAHGRRIRAIATAGIGAIQALLVWKGRLERETGLEPATLCLGRTLVPARGRTLASPLRPKRYQFPGCFGGERDVRVRLQTGPSRCTSGSTHKT